MEEFVAGKIYRRTELHKIYGGQTQGGISTPAKQNVILLFTGETGAQHGYTNGWLDGVFNYFGEGQIGDMPGSGAILVSGTTSPIIKPYYYLRCLRSRGHMFDTSVSLSRVDGDMSRVRTKTERCDAA